MSPPGGTAHQPQEVESIKNTEVDSSPSLFFFKFYIHLSKILKENKFLRYNYHYIIYITKSKKYKFLI